MKMLLLNAVLCLTVGFVGWAIADISQPGLTPAKPPAPSEEALCEIRFERNSPYYRLYLIQGNNAQLLGSTRGDNDQLDLKAFQTALQISEQLIENKICTSLKLAPNF